MIRKLRLFDLKGQRCDLSAGPSDQTAAKTPVDSETDEPAGSRNMLGFSLPSPAAPPALFEEETRLERWLSYFNVQGNGLQ